MTSGGAVEVEETYLLYSFSWENPLKNQEWIDEVSLEIY